MRNVVSNVARIGVAGAGSISIRGILPHLSQEDVQDRIRLAAICDPVPGRAEAARERFGAEQSFTVYDEMLAKGDLDLVTIASPIGLHYEQGKKALLAGKHVHFCKTMTTTCAEATELIDLARENGLKIVASPGHCLRSQTQQIRKLIAEGALGTLCWAVTGAAAGAGHEAEPLRGGSGILEDINPAWYYRKPGGGPLYDRTVYGMHELTTVLGSARRVTGLSGLRVKERFYKGQPIVCDMDDNTFFLLDFGESLFAFVYGAVAGGFRGTSFFGTKGSIVGGSLNGEPIDFPGRSEATGVQGAWVAGMPHVVGAHLHITEAHVFEDIMQLVDWVREGKPSPVTAEHARHVIEIFEAAYRSAETGQAQTLTTSF